MYFPKKVWKLEKRLKTRSNEVLLKAQEIFSLDKRRLCGGASSLSLNTPRVTGRVISFFRDDPNWAQLGPTAEDAGRQIFVQ